MKSQTNVRSRRNDHDRNGKDSLCQVLYRQAKGSTCYGIATALIRITRAIYGDENSVLTLSSYLQGEYGQEDVYIGSPCIVNRDGIVGHVRLNMTEEEAEKFDASGDLLRRTYEGLKLTQ